MSKKSDKIIKSLVQIIQDDNCLIKQANLPANIRAFLMLDDTRFIIVLNCSLKRKITSLIHELLHIYFNDIEKNSIKLCENKEKRAHYYTKYIKKHLTTSAKKLFLKYIKESEIV